MPEIGAAEGSSGVGHRVSGEGAEELGRFLQLPPHGGAGSLTGGNEDAAIGAGTDEGIRHLDGVEHRVAGVLDVHDRRCDAELGGHDVGRGRFHQVLTRTRENQQIHVAGRLLQGM